MLKSGLLVKIALTILILSGMVWLARAGVADFIRLRPCAYIDGLAGGTVAFDPVELDNSRRLLLLARSWDPANPVIPEYLGQIDFRLAGLVAFSPAMQATFLRKVIADYDDAIALRPNSAYLWAARMTAGSRLLQVKVLANEPVDETELKRISLALERAAILDPWNPSVLQQIVDVGALRYRDFSPENQKIVDEAVMRAKQIGIKI